MIESEKASFLQSDFNVIHTTRPSNPPMEIPYVTIGELRAPRSIERLIWERKNAYPYFYLLYLLAQNASQICELGIRSGRSTRAILFGLKNSQSGTLTSIDLPDLSPQKPILNEPLPNRLKNWLRPIAHSGGSWLGESETSTSVKRLKRLGLGKYFFHLETDFFELPLDWFQRESFDLIFIDFDPCDFVDVFTRFVSHGKRAQLMAIHNSLRDEEQTGIAWLTSQPFFRRSVSFSEGAGLTLVQID